MKTCLRAAVILALLLDVLPALALSNGWPVPSGSVTSTIGWRRDPFGSGMLKWHNGTDIAVPLHTPVTPTGSGLVRFAGWHK
ncbi:MAG TPA: M23 family peptidase, partial [Geobacteraceae bacterium]